jgi:hypothetical protein
MINSKQFQKWGHVAENMALEGKTIDEIAMILPVDRCTIGNWSTALSWQDKILQKINPKSLHDDLLRSAQKENNHANELPAGDERTKTMANAVKLVKAAESLIKDDEDIYVENIIKGFWGFIHWLQRGNDDGYADRVIMDIVEYLGTLE